MNYTPNAPDGTPLEINLGLSQDQVKKVQQSVQKAYDELYANGKPDFSTHEVFGMIAPVLETPEEAFYAATVVWTDLIGHGIGHQPSTN